MKIYLKSISYELSDIEKAMLILNSTDMFYQRDELLKLAQSTTDSKLADMIYARYELKELAKQLFETNDGRYIYFLINGEAEIHGVFRYIQDILSFVKKNPTDFNDYLVERHKIMTIEVSQENCDLAIFTYRKNKEPECVVPDTDMIKTLKQAAQGKTILNPDYKLTIPTPFQKGDIVLFEFDNYRKIGILENDCTQYEPDKNIPTVTYINDSGYLSSTIFYPYTSEIAHSYYDPITWDSLVKISDILKGGKKYKITQVFERVRW